MNCEQFLQVCLHPLRGWPSRMHGTRIYSGGAEDHHGNRIELKIYWEMNGIYLSGVKLALEMHHLIQCFSRFNSCLFAIFKCHVWLRENHLIWNQLKPLQTWRFKQMCHSHSDLQNISHICHLMVIWFILGPAASSWLCRWWPKVKLFQHFDFRRPAEVQPEAGYTTVKCADAKWLGEAVIIENQQWGASSPCKGWQMRGECWQLVCEQWEGCWRRWMAPRFPPFINMDATWLKWMLAQQAPGMGRVGCPHCSSTW